MLKIMNQTKESAEIYLKGRIISDEDGVIISEESKNPEAFFSPKDLKLQLEKLNGKNLLIHIQSEGGDISAGVAMANMIARHKGHTTAIVDGFCCSVATQIFFSADTCKIPSNCYLMVHKPLFFAFGITIAENLRKKADELDIIQQSLETACRKKTKNDIKPEDITKMINATTWLTGKEAAKYFEVEVLDAMKNMKSLEELKKEHSFDYQETLKKLANEDAYDKISNSVLLKILMQEADQNKLLNCYESEE